MAALYYTLGVIALSAILAVFAYLDGIYRELGRVTGAHFHEHLDVFEAEIEPLLHWERRQAALAFSVLSQVLLVAVAVVTARGVNLLVPGVAPAVVQVVVYLLVEILLFAEFLPYILLARSSGRWLRPLIPALRLGMAIAWPLCALLQLAMSVAHISDQEPASDTDSQEGVGALVDAAQEEGILASDEAQLIEQVVEFGDKRVLELMTPRPDIVAISADATIEKLGELLVETRVSRVVVYQSTLDDVVGIAQTQDLLQISDQQAASRTVRGITRPVLFVPETKLGSELLKEMQRLNEHMAVAVDEHGLVAGVVTVEDLVEEIVGEMGKPDLHAAPDVVREADGSVVLRGSVGLGRLQALFGIEFAPTVSESGTATTVAGLLNSIAGHVPKAGERLSYDGLQFEVLEANQRKVLRLRVRPGAAVAPAP